MEKDLLTIRDLKEKESPGRYGIRNGKEEYRKGKKGDRVLKRARFAIPFLLLTLLLVALACGKKAPPTLPKMEFPVRVVDLSGEWEEGNLYLKGDINTLKKPGGKGVNMVKGCRVYYGQYTLENPPCAGCPIEYNGYHEFGPEVIKEGDFSCVVPGKTEGHVYFLKVSLIGPDGAAGPSSNTIRVAAK